MVNLRVVKIDGQNILNEIKYCGYKMPVHFCTGIKIVRIKNYYISANIPIRVLLDVNLVYVYSVRKYEHAPIPLTERTPWFCP